MSAGKTACTVVTVRLYALVKPLRLMAAAAAICFPRKEVTPTMLAITWSGWWKAAALMRWNKRMNLVGARTWREAARDLLADSLELAVFLRTLQKEGLMPAAPVVWDLGAGAGLPGIPLRLFWPAGDYHLVEARQKRSIFLADMCARLELPRTFVHGERAETFFAAHEGQGQVVVSRAFMPWKALLPFVALGRGQIADPEWSNKTRDGLTEEIRPCIGCLYCLKEYGEGRRAKCAVNPEFGRELTFRELKKDGAGRKAGCVVLLYLFEISKYRF